MNNDYPYSYTSYPVGGGVATSYSYPVYYPVQETRDQFIRKWVEKLRMEMTIDLAIAQARHIWDESLRNEKI